MARATLVGWCWGLILLGMLTVKAPAADTLPVGVARVDITPDFPVRLTGYANRSTESEGVAMHIFAKALALGDDSGAGPAVLITVENCGVPASLTRQVATALAAKAKLRPERLAICSTHTHTGPWLKDFLPLHSMEKLPAEHSAHIEQYTNRLGQWMEEAALAALANRRPARLAWTQGKVPLAMNRRPVKDGRCPGLGVNPQGPVDHALPLLRVQDTAGRVLAILLNYACHCTTLTGKHNQIHGDWAGVAQKLIEDENPGAVALVAIGCGGDANPEPRGEMEMTLTNGKAVADEARRLLHGAFTAVAPRIESQRVEIKLPFQNVPDRAELQKRLEVAAKAKPGTLDARRGALAAHFLAQLDAGKPLQTALDYPVTAWAFGDDLAMVFLPGEVVVDYALRLKKEFDARRMWINAYSNDVPCYIVSRRVLAEGGYEPDTSMLGYGKPGQLDPCVEERIIEAVHQTVPRRFAAPQ